MLFQPMKDFQSATQLHFEFTIVNLYLVEMMQKNEKKNKRKFHFLNLNTFTIVSGSKAPKALQTVFIAHYFGVGKLLVRYTIRPM